MFQFVERRIWKFAINSMDVNQRAWLAVLRWNSMNEKCIVAEWRATSDEQRPRSHEGQAASFLFDLTWLPFGNIYWQHISFSVLCMTYIRVFVCKERWAMDETVICLMEKRLMSGKQRTSERWKDKKTTTGQRISDKRRETNDPRWTNVELRANG